MSRKFMNFIDEELSWANMWRKTRYSNVIIKQYHDKYQISLNTRVISSGVSFNYENPYKQGMKICAVAIKKRFIQFMGNDFYVLLIFTSNNAHYHGNGLKKHEMEKMANLATVRLMYNVLQYQLTNMRSSSSHLQYIDVRSGKCVYEVYTNQYYETDLPRPAKKEGKKRYKKQSRSNKPGYGAEFGEPSWENKEKGTNEEPKVKNGGYKY